MSWEQLLSIAQEARDIADQERSEPPVACPNDGEPLQLDSHGRLHCKYDGWTHTAN